MTKKQEPKTLNDVMEMGKVSNRLPDHFKKQLIRNGWEFGDFHMSQKYKGYELIIEFCIGDFCSSICSKKSNSLLEAKIRNETFPDALISVEKYKSRIDAGEHWQGEEF